MTDIHEKYYRKYVIDCLSKDFYNGWETINKLASDWKKYDEDISLKEYIFTHGVPENIAASRKDFLQNIYKTPDFAISTVDFSDLAAWCTETDYDYRTLYTTKENDKMCDW